MPIDLCTICVHNAEQCMSAHGPCRHILIRYAMDSMGMTEYGAKSYAEERIKNSKNPTKRNFKVEE